MRLFGHLRFLVGFVAMSVALAALAEVFLRSYPPRDLHDYLGDESPLAGPLAPDDRAGVRYASWQSFAASNAEGLQRAGQLTPTAQDSRPVWAMFGNSFVQMHGMLADTARKAIPSRRIFNLGRNEHLLVRLAQVRLLLEQGLRAERIFIVLLPLDTALLGPQPLETIRVNNKGALTYEPRHPWLPLSLLTDNSRLAFAAWCRSGRQQGNPSFKPKHLNHGIAPSIVADLCHVLEATVAVATKHHTPVTVVLIPNHEQIMGKASCAWQQALKAAFEQRGLDVCDTTPAFLQQPERDLFIPDKHFNERGNRILLQAVLAHIGWKSTSGSPLARVP